MEMKNRKGNVSILVPSVLALVLAAVILIFGLIMLDELKNDTGTNSGSADLETITQAELVASTTVDKSGECEFGDFSVAACYNKTGAGKLISSGNYTVGANYITNTTSEFVTDSWMCNYTYSYGGEACLAANDTIVGLGKYSDYFDLIVLAIVISVIIGLLLIVFSMRKTQ